MSGSWQSGGEFHKGTCRCTGAVTVFASPLQPSPASAAAMPFALAALGVHTVAMLAAIAVISVAVYNWIGVAFLRRAWINLDLIWIAALLICGVVLLASQA